MLAKEYKDKAEKVIDFLIGLIFLPIAYLLLNRIVFAYVLREVHGYVISLANAAINIVSLIAVIYLSIFRRYIGFGVLAAIVLIPLILLGTCFLLMSGLGHR